MAGAVIFVLLVGANLATPLYPLLQAELGLTTLDVTAAFASYVLALVATLMLAGHWSDHIGRRAALILAVLVGLAGGWVFARPAPWPRCAPAGPCREWPWPWPPAPVRPRCVNCCPPAPNGPPASPCWPPPGEWRRAPSSAASLAAAGPTAMPYYVHSVVLAALLVPLYLLRARPAISQPPVPRPMQVLAPRRPSVSREARGAFWLASGVGFLSFAVFGFCLSLAPGYFAQVLHADSRPLIGVLAGLTLGASALSQLLAVRGRFVVPAGLAILGAAVLLIARGRSLAQPAAAAGGITAGIGQGVAFRTVFNDVARRSSRPGMPRLSAPST